MTPGAAQADRKMNARRQEADGILFYFLSGVNAGQVSRVLGDR